MNKIIKLSGQIVCFFLISLLSSQTLAGVSKLAEAKQYYQKEEYKKAHKSLSEIPFSDLDPKRMALVELFRGIIFYDQKDYNNALRSLNKSIKIGTRLPDVANYYKGLSHLKLSNNKLAMDSFSSVEKSGSSTYLDDRSQYHLAQIKFETGDFKGAKTLFKKLEKKMRRADVYPDILWSLLKINHQSKRRLDTCFWARKLYKKFPNYKPIAHWGLQWKDNLVDGKTLKCKDTLADQKSRIKRLQLVGASDKAFAELNVLQSSDVEPFVKDVIMSEYLVNEGHVREALNRLMPYYQDKKKRKDFKYLGLLAKAASRAGEYQTAIGIYTEAHDKLKGLDKRRALYRAAFLSYQNQDYDGAIRRFEILAKNYSYSSLGKQANWYLSWLHYLKGNYQKAYNQFAKNLKRRHRRLPSTISKEKVKYWMAMSLMKLGNKEAAKELFLEISQDEYIGYYSIASIQRLRDVMGERALASSEHNPSLAFHENWLPHFGEEEKAHDEIDFAQKQGQKTETYFAEWEDLPYMQEYLDMENPASIFAQVSEPIFRNHIERAKDMSLMGLRQLAKWELYTIEGRTKNKDYLKTLMFEYHRNEVFHRSSYIG
ncbi:MAG: tetratricopeptide repeat protein, partial [Bdellovibrionales bacterium]|nr:tetratricopeptide repeat protein [Bdellovibrionales bacterium]NQZ19597.1 tetratricopeptide repeat protein [Bdellovibrionales bacterium]